MAGPATLRPCRPVWWCCCAHVVPCMILTCTELTDRPMAAAFYFLFSSRARRLCHRLSIREVVPNPNTPAGSMHAERLLCAMARRHASAYGTRRSLARQRVRRRRFYDVRELRGAVTCPRTVTSLRLTTWRHLNVARRVRSFASTAVYMHTTGVPNVASSSSLREISRNLPKKI